MTTDELITFPLSKLLRYIVRDFDFAEIDSIDAEIFALKDPREELCHVELLPAKPDKARLWRIKAWREDYNRICAMREKAAKERREANIFSENREKLVAYFMKGTRLSEQAVMPLVNKMLYKRNAFKIAEAAGIQLDKGDKTE